MVFLRVFRLLLVYSQNLSWFSVTCGLFTASVWLDMLHLSSKTSKPVVQKPSNYSCCSAATCITMSCHVISGVSSKSTLKAKGKFEASERVEAYKNFVTTNCHILIANPTLLWQQALNQPHQSLINRDMTSLMEREVASDGELMTSLSLVEWMNKSDREDACAFTLSGLSEVGLHAFSQRFRCTE